MSRLENHSPKYVIKYTHTAAQVLKSLTIMTYCMSRGNLKDMTYSNYSQPYIINGQVSCLLKAKKIRQY